MARYLCPECGDDSFVVETRAAAGKALRRRRKCTTLGHKFSTLEVPADAPQKIVELVQWAVRNNVTDDFSNYVHNVLCGAKNPEVEKAI